jgi:hypothetical protein
MEAGFSISRCKTRLTTLAIRVTRFLSVQNTKNKQNGNNIPNGHKVYENALKQALQTYNIHNIFHCKTLQNVPKVGFFWFKNIYLPSGNPVGDSAQNTLQFYNSSLGMYMQSSAIFRDLCSCCKQTFAVV